jgi:hypothetical protein
MLKMSLKYLKTLALIAISVFISCSQVKKQMVIVEKPKDEPIALAIENESEKKTVIKFDNSSFEDEPGTSHTPKGWDNCGFNDETPPDTAPVDNYLVTQKAFHGYTYLGMVTRDVKTWEVVGQKLKKTIPKDSCYIFSICLMRSPNYVSMSQATQKIVNYNKPIVLRVWGGNTRCIRGELLAESPKIENEKWKKYIFTIQPKRDIQFIMFEAFYDASSEVAYNGNVLLDNLSDLIPCKSN